MKKKLLKKINWEEFPNEIPSETFVRYPGGTFGRVFEEIPVVYFWEHPEQFPVDFVQDFPEKHSKALFGNWKYSGRISGEIPS